VFISLQRDSVLGAAHSTTVDVRRAQAESGTGPSPIKLNAKTIPTSRLINKQFSMQLLPWYTLHDSESHKTTGHRMGQSPAIGLSGGNRSFRLPRSSVFENVRNSLVRRQFPSSENQDQEGSEKEGERRSRHELVRIGKDRKQSFPIRNYVSHGQVYRQN